MRSPGRILPYGASAFSALLLMLALVSCAQGPGPSNDAEELGSSNSIGLVETRPAPPRIRAARASFLLALESIEAGSPKNALKYLDRAEDLTSIKDYLLFYRAQAYRGAGRFGEEERAYDTLLKRHPDSALVAEARYQRAEALRNAHRWKASRNAFDEFIALHPKDPRIGTALLTVARLSLSTELGDPGRAGEAVKRILAHYPALEGATSASVILTSIATPWSWPRALTPNAFVPAAPLPGKLLSTTLSTEERFARAISLSRAARHTEAAAGFEEIYKDGDDKTRNKAAVRYAASLVRLKRYTKAKNVLTDYLRSKKSSETETRALHWLMVSAFRGRDMRLLEKVEKELGQKARGGASHVKALYFIGRLHEQRGEVDSAVSAYLRAVREGTDGAADKRPSGQNFYMNEAAWGAGWLRYRAKSFIAAFEIFSTYDESNPKRAEGGRFLYWSARTAEKLGRDDEAKGLYERVCNEFKSDYYCTLVRTRIGTIGDVYKGPGLTPGRDAQTLPDAFALEAHYRAARELLAMGLGSLATREITLTAARYRASAPEMKAVAELYHEAGDYYRAFITYASYLAANGRKGTTHAGGGGGGEFLFPMQVVELVRESAEGIEVDEYLVAAVMREESSFNPKVVSKAGAIGIMQIMPETADYIAGKLGDKGFVTEELFDTSTSIRLGAWYLARIGRRFDRNNVRTIAAYNAGPTAVAKWIRKLPESPDEFVESIPYPETRTYTKRVLASYSAYLARAGSTMAETDRTFAQGRAPARQP